MKITNIWNIINIIASIVTIGGAFISVSYSVSSKKVYERLVDNQDLLYAGLVFDMVNKVRNKMIKTAMYSSEDIKCFPKDKKAYEECDQEIQNIIAKLPEIFIEARKYLEEASAEIEQAIAANKKLIYKYDKSGGDNRVEGSYNIVKRNLSTAFDIIKSRKQELERKV